MIKKTSIHIIISHFLVAIFFIIISCEQVPKKDEDSKLEHDTEISIHNIKKDDVEILLIDGCEYIVYKESDGANRAYGYMSHKGNCKNPIHCRNEQ